MYADLAFNGLWSSQMRPSMDVYLAMTLHRMAPASRRTLGSSMDKANKDSAPFLTDPNRQLYATKASSGDQNDGYCRDKPRVWYVLN